MSLTNAKPARVVYADLVRLIAILMVVLIHSAAPIFSTAAIGSAAFTVSALLDGIAHAGVPLFIMVSGMFLLDEKREVTVRRAIRHYALPLVGLYFFWSFIYATTNKVAMPLLLENATISGGIVRDFLIGVLTGAYHMWYLPMMVGLYLITPLLRRFVRADNRHLVRWFLLIVLVLRFVLPTGIELCKEFVSIDLAADYERFHLLAGWEYPAYYVAGWYITNTRPDTRTRHVIYAAGALALAALLALTVWMSAHRGEGVAYMMETSLFCFVYSVALFALIAWQGQSLKSNALLSRLSGLSFGVYILHVEIQQLYKMIFPYTGNALVYILVQWIAVTAISFAAAWVVSHIPLLKRAVRL